MRTAPPALSHASTTAGSPKPVPPRPCLVVKNGSAARATVASSMPTPVSVTLSEPKRPGSMESAPAASSSSSHHSCPDGQLTPRLLHRVARVQRHVDERLFQLPRIGSHPDLVLGRRNDQCALHAEHVVEQGPQLTHGRVELDLSRAHALSPCEREQLAWQARRVLRRAAQLQHVAGRRAVLVELRQDQRRIAPDRSEGVVEIVGDLAREQSEGLQLLRPQELRFEVAPLLAHSVLVRDVTRSSCQPHHVAACVDGDRTTSFDDPLRAARARPAERDLVVLRTPSARCTVATTRSRSSGWISSM